MLHGTLVAIDVDVARAQTFDDLREFPCNGLRAAHDDVVDCLQFFIGGRVAELGGACTKGWPCALHFNCAAGLVTGRIIVLSGTLLAVVGGPHELAANLNRLFISVSHDAAEQVTKVFGTGFVTGLLGGVDVDLLQPFGGVHQGTQVHVRMAVLGRPHHALRAAGSGEPDVWAGVLHGLNPGVHHPVFIVLAFMTEGTVIGPASDNQVVGLLEPGKVFGGVLPGQQSLHGGAADETRDDPASGIAVQHGNLFSHANGVANRNHVAQNGNFDSFG